MMPPQRLLVEHQPVGGTIYLLRAPQQIRRALRSILGTRNYSLEMAATARDALAAAVDHSPDLVVLDLALPDGNGLNLLPSMKKKWPDTEVIVLTGDNSVATVMEATKRGAFFYQPKPYSTDTLKVLVERALEQKNMNEEK